MRMEAVMSPFTCLSSQPNKAAMLSTCRTTCLPPSISGMVRKGRRRPTISNVVDLDPNKAPFLSLAWFRNSGGR